jgi:hypothetical protein
MHNSRRPSDRGLLSYASLQRPAPNGLLRLGSATVTMSGPDSKPGHGKILMIFKLHFPLISDILNP